MLIHMLKQPHTLVAQYRNKQNVLSPLFPSIHISHYSISAICCVLDVMNRVFNRNNYECIRTYKLEGCLSGGMSAYLADVYYNVVTTMTWFSLDASHILLLQVNIEKKNHLKKII